jgi:hypothetical protein
LGGTRGLRPTPNSLAELAETFGTLHRLSLGWSDAQLRRVGPPVDLARQSILWSGMWTRRWPQVGTSIRADRPPVAARPQQGDACLLRGDLRLPQRGATAGGRPAAVRLRARIEREAAGG